jgi:hypothetical protein
MTDQPRFAVPDIVRANQQIRALARRPQPCMLCGAWTKTHLWPAGWHCPPCANSRGLQPVAEEVAT